MSTQTERITILSTPEFKGWLLKEAELEGMSLSELIRNRCQAGPSKDEELLAALIQEVRVATKRAERSLDKGLKDAEEILTELRSKRK